MSVYQALAGFRYDHIHLSRTPGSRSSLGHCAAWKTRGSGRRKTLALTRLVPPRPTHTSMTTDCRGTDWVGRLTICHESIRVSSADPLVQSICLAKRNRPRLEESRAKMAGDSKLRQDLQSRTWKSTIPESELLRPALFTAFQYADRLLGLCARHSTCRYTPSITGTNDNDIVRWSQIVDR